LQIGLTFWAGWPGVWASCFTLLTVTRMASIYHLAQLISIGFGSCNPWTAVQGGCDPPVLGLDFLLKLY
jgi:hypothetical protein